MARKHFSTRTLAVMTLWAGLAAGQAGAQPKADEVLARQPLQPGVNITNPTAAEAASLRVDQVNWPETNGVKPTGIVVKDAQGRTVRQFVDTTGRGSPNMWSYFLNGVEAYREVDANGNGKPDQFRWVGANGGKWGIDGNEDGIVDNWHNISQAELSQELFHVMKSGDPKHLAALLPTQAELESIGLPKDEITKILQKTSGIAAKIQETANQLQLGENAKWMHIEVGVPQVMPADTFGGRDDYIKQPSTTVLVEKGDGKSVEPFQTGEMVLIGRAWRLIDGPAPGAAIRGSEGPTESIKPELVPLIAKLNEIKFPAETTPVAIANYHILRAQTLEEIVGKTQGAEQEPWLRQVIDTYAAAAESNPTEPAAMTRLKQWQQQILQIDAKGPLASYVAFRVLAAEYAANLSKAKPDEVVKVQAGWREQLEAFIKAHPSTPETPEALLRLAVASEFSGKETEGQAKTWYETLAKNFPNHPHANRAIGAVKRLTSEGQAFTLAGQTLDGKAFTMDQVAGKVVVVFYWATWGRDAANELKQLAELVKTYGEKGLVVVSVNLDEEPQKAIDALTAAQLPGAHLHMPGGLDRSPLATAYGIQMVPHIFVVGKDGKVVNRNTQSGAMLKDEIEKLTK